MAPMNQKFTRFFVVGMEVGEAYSVAVEQILSNPEFSKWKYVLTLEEDNLPPQDGLLKLYENMNKFDVIGGLYWTKGEVPEGEAAVPIGKAAVLRQGEQISVVALASMVGPALAAAHELEAEGISAEVIDPRTISPLDIDMIANSVKKTSRMIVAHEAVEQGGIGDEIIARVQQEPFHYLDSPIARVAAPFAPVPASPALEKQFLPSKEKIIAAIRVALP